MPSLSTESGAQAVPRNPLTPQPGLLLSTGIGQLDEFLGGGLSPGSMIVLWERSGGGAEIFAKQFASGVPPDEGTSSLYVSTEEGTREVENAILRFGFPAMPKILSIAERHAHLMLEKEMQSASRQLGAVATEGLLKTDSADLLRPAESKGHQDFLHELFLPYLGPRPPRRLTIHTLDLLFASHGEDRVFDFITALKAATSKIGGLSLLVMAGREDKPAVEGNLERAADCFIELEFQRKSSQFEKYLVVRKVKNQYAGLGVAPYHVSQRGFELDNLTRIL